ncbi:MAG: hypothetical protein A2Y38_01240 [Spirochaetes bacterium GWB1_59_5]|nr:MAG: hypothetical protein A2Y38_01240 [Spirochaetes bacterium GWB1_59_5]
MYIFGIKNEHSYLIHKYGPYQIWYTNTSGKQMGGSDYHGPTKYRLVRVLQEIDGEVTVNILRIGFTRGGAGSKKQMLDRLKRCIPNRCK